MHSLRDRRVVAMFIETTLGIDYRYRSTGFWPETG